MKLSKRRWIGLGLLIGLILLLLWALFSGSGLRLLLRQVPGLTFDQVQGRLVGPIEGASLQWRNESLLIEIEGLRTDYRFWRLVGGRMVIPELNAARVTVMLLTPPEQAPTETFELSSWQLHLPPLDLPVDVELGGLQLDRLQVIDAQETVLFDGSAQADALSLIDGRLSLPRLVLDAEQPGRLELSAELDSRQRWAGQLRLQADLEQAHDLAAELSLQGDMDEYTIAARSTGALTADLALRLRALDSAPAWTLDLQATRPAPDGAATGQGPSFQLDLGGSGERGSGELSGQVRLNGDEQLLRIETLPFRLADDFGLSINEGRLALLGALSGQLRLSGNWPLQADAGDGDVQLGWTDLVLVDANAESDPEAAPLRSEEGSLRLRGLLDDYALTLDAPLQRDDRAGVLTLQGSGDLQQLREVALTLASNFGQAALSGSVQFEPFNADLRVDLDALQPEVLLPSFPGELRLQGRTQIALVDEQLQASLRIDTLSGELRQAELDGTGELAWVQDQLPTGTLKLGWGNNRIDYQRQAGSAAQLLLDARQLELLVADLSGRLDASLTLPERLADWQLAHGEASVAGFRLGEIEAESLRFNRAAGGPSEAFRVTAQGMELPRQRLDTLELLLQPGDSWTIQAQAEGPDMELALEGSATRQDDRWRGSLALLDLQTAPWPKLQLQAPAAWQWGGAESELEQACLAVETGRLCATLDVDDDGPMQVRLALEALELRLLDPLLTTSGVQLGGQLDGNVEALWSADSGLALSGTLAIPAFLASVPAPSGGERLEKRAVVEIELVPPDGSDPRQRLDLRLGLADQGALQLQVAGMLLADSPDWDVRVQSDQLALSLLEGLHEELLQPEGSLAADLQLRHRVGQWAGEGALSITEGALELPLLGLQLSALTLRLEATPAGEFVLDGSGRSGKGEFQLNGRYPIDPAADAEFSLKGETIQVVNLPIVRMEASPDLRVVRADGKVSASGSVTIPSALIDLARFEPSVKASSDVVVVDDPPVESGSPLAVSADIQVIMGKAVRLKGFGLDGRLSGALSVRERPGRPTTGRGELNVTGEFAAYGQDLTIKRGKLLFSGGPLANPGLDLLAIREVGTVEAGVRVRGAADRPELSIYSDPPMDQAEAFSYLVLGRPLNAVSGDDSQQLGAAAAALGSVGGGLIASKLGAGTGLAIEMESSADLGGAALTVGRYITPDIYFGVGQSLFEQIQVAILRYRLTSTLELEALSGREFKAGVNYRLER